MRVDVGGIQIELLGARAARRDGTLLVADLHLGKSESMRAAGAPMCDGDAAEQLDRIDRLVALTGVECVVVLGDLLHAAAGLTERLIESVANWRRSHRWDMRVVRGNHDCVLDGVAEAWSLRVLQPGTVEDGLELVHDPFEASRTRPWVAGHVHPAVRIGGAANSIKLPCFHLVGGLGLILPAFSLFTGGSCVRAHAADRLFATTGQRVLEVAGAGTRTPRP
ncbi:MAG: ligase-associated DNA damage response endonuclease PdeM [Phycisphaerales bacterium]|nr:ligase-associated DNA damage response endonuclease PdeM [Phycisphaerales bacterium]